MHFLAVLRFFVRKSLDCRFEPLVCWGCYMMQGG